MRFVLDHLGHNTGGDDLESWKKALQIVAKCPNVVAKLGAIEEWEVSDPLPYLEFALNTFGYDRCMYESNWFVSAAMGDAYSKTYEYVCKALHNLEATSEEQEQVFCGTAVRVYQL